MKDDDTPPRGAQGCLSWLMISGGGMIVLGVAAVILFILAARDPTSISYQILRVIRGQKGAEELATEIIIDRLAYKNKVSRADAAKLKREMGPISRDLPALSEGEKHQLAMLIRKAMEDGVVNDGELGVIRAYTRRSAADGDAEP